MNTRLLICLGALVGVTAFGQQREQPTAKLTVRVVNESAQPVSDADVRIGFSERFSRSQVTLHGTTNGQGEFAAEGYSDVLLDADASRTGYYDSGASPTVFKEVIDGRWQPWNSTAEIILRPIGKPTALYSRCIRKLEIPAVGQSCGFDLEVSDWVAPLGKGKVADFVITLDQRRFDGRKDFDVAVSVRFSNPKDGILETKLPEIGRNSVFKWERFAPETGYEPTFKTQLSAKPNEGYTSTTSDKQAFFFRVRTVEQNGQIVSALYGKIAGGIVLEARRTQTCSLAFTYYLNPTPLDRNLEWDTKRNLIPGLSREETPRDP